MRSSFFLVNAATAVTLAFVTLCLPGNVMAQSCQEVQGTTSLAVSSSGAVYTADAASGTVSIVNLMLNTHRTVAIGGNPQRVVYDNLGDQALILDPSGPRVVVLRPDDTWQEVTPHSGIAIAAEPILLLREGERDAYVGTTEGVWRINLDNLNTRGIDLGAEAVSGRGDSGGELLAVVLDTVPATVATLEAPSTSFDLHSGLPFASDGYRDVSTNPTTGTVYLLSSTGKIVALPLGGGAPFTFNPAETVDFKGIGVDDSVALDRVIVAGSRLRIYTGQGQIVRSELGSVSSDAEVVVPEPGTNRILVWQNERVIRWKGFAVSSFASPGPIARSDGSVPRPVHVPATNTWVVAAEQANALYELDPASGVWSVFPLGFRGRHVVYDKLTDRLIVLTREGAAVTLDVDLLLAVSRLNLAFDPLTAQLDPLRSRLLVGSGWSEELVSIDLSTGDSSLSLAGVSGVDVAVDPLSGNAYALDTPGFLTEWDPASGQSQEFSSSPDPGASLVGVNERLALVMIAVRFSTPRLELYNRLTATRLNCPIPLGAPATSLTVAGDNVLVGHGPKGRVSWVDFSAVVATNCGEIGTKVEVGERAFANGILAVDYHAVSQQGLVLDGSGTTLHRMTLINPPGLPPDLALNTLALPAGSPATDLFVDATVGTVLVSRISDLVIVHTNGSRTTVPVPGVMAATFDTLRQDAYVLTKDNRLYRVDLLTDTPLLIGDVATLWRCLPLPSGTPLATLPDRQDERFLYVGTDGFGFFRSEDGGGSFAAQNTGLTAGQVFAITQDPLAPDVLYIGTETGVFKSTSRGATWAVTPGLTTGTVVDVLAVDDGTSNTVVLAAVAGTGVLRSTDGGQTFVPANSGLTSLDVRQFDADDEGSDTPVPIWGFTGGGPFRTLDLAGSWSSTSGTTTPIGSLQTVSGSVTTGIAWAGTADAGVFRSVDDGDTWDAVNQGLPAGATPNIEALEILEDGTVLSGLNDADRGGMFAFDPGTSTWRDLNSGLTDRRVRHLSSASGSLGQRVFASTEGGLFGAQLQDRDTDNDGLVDVLDPDDDNDGVADEADCAPRDGAIGGALPEIQNVQFQGDSQIDWNSTSGAASYQVFRGSRQDGGGVEFNHLCLEEVTSGPAALDTSIPLVGELFYYFIGAGDRCTLGTLGLADLGERPNPACDLDADDDTVPDSFDVDPFDPFTCIDTDGDTCDDCAVIGAQDPSDDGADLDGDGVCDAGDADRDGDSVDDVADPNSIDPTICGDGTKESQSDGCDDCSSEQLDDLDRDSICDLFDPDRDGDTVPNGIDPDPMNYHICGDTDSDFCDDCRILPTSSVGFDGTDFDLDGLCDDGDPDDDDDGIDDVLDNCPFKNSLDQSDSNGDGIGDICSIFVDQAGGGDFTDLVNAVAASVSGDVILIGPGLYTNFVVLPPGVSLKGTGVLGSTIIDNSNQEIHAVYAYHADPADVLLTGATVIENLEFQGYAIDATGGPTVRANRFRSVCTTGTNTFPQLLNGVVSIGSAPPGFSFEAKVIDNEFLDLNQGCAPEQEPVFNRPRLRAIHTRGDVIISGNRIQNARLFLPVITAYGTVGKIRVVDNEIIDTQGAIAVHVFGGTGTVTVSGNRIESFEQIEYFSSVSGNDGATLFLDGGGTGEVLIEKNLILNSNTGLAIPGISIEIFTGPLRVHNNVVIGNSGSDAISGMKIRRASGTFLFSNNTIVDNHSADSFPPIVNYGLYFDLVSAGTCAIQNSIVANHPGDAGGGLRLTAGLGSALCHNNVFGNSPVDYLNDDPTGSAGNISVDPLLDAQGQPLAGSPCIDSGNEPGAPVDDVLGAPRPVDCDGDSIPETDIGAYELQCP